MYFSCTGSLNIAQEPVLSQQNNHSCSQTISPRIRDSANQIAGNTCTNTGQNGLILLDRITRPTTNQIPQSNFSSIDLTGGLDAFLMLRSNVGVAKGVKRSPNTESEGAPLNKRGKSVSVCFYWFIMCLHSSCC